MTFTDRFWNLKANTNKIMQISRLEKIFSGKVNKYINVNNLFKLNLVRQSCLLERET